MNMNEWMCTGYSMTKQSRLNEYENEHALRPPYDTACVKPVELTPEEEVFGDDGNWAKAVGSSSVPFVRPFVYMCMYTTNLRLVKLGHVQMK